jgi:pantetheine-phosphate adenylyltransferase
MHSALKRVVYPGSFDPVTNGHLDVIQRAATIFDEVIVAVARNAEKRALFSTEERMELLRQSTAHLEKVRVASFQGLLVNFAKEQGASAVVRGLRAISDFEFEFQMALMNRKLEPTLETLFLMPREEYTSLSSRVVKEIAQLGGQVAPFVPAPVLESLANKFGSA